MMIVIVDEWCGIKSRESSLQDVTWVDVARLIRRLDAGKHTLVSLKADESNSLTVGGGNGKFVVTVAIEGDKFFELINPEPTEAAIVMLNTGGQEGEFPADQIVGEESAIACAMTYLKSAKMDQRYSWRES